MSDIEKWSDDKLRNKLIEYGFPIMPITGTTRKVMIKKLKLLVENKEKRPDRRSMAQFSSEEESEGESNTKKKNRRATMAVVPPTMQPPKNVTRKSVKPAKDSEFKEERERKVMPSRGAKIISLVENEAETNSDSEPDIVETDYKESFTRDTIIRRTTSGSSEVSSPTLSSPSSRYSPPKRSQDTSNTSSKYSPGRYSTYTASTMTSTRTPSETLSQIRSRLSLGSPRLATYDNSLHHHYDEEDSATTGVGTATTPFLSSFTKKLSQLSSQNKDDNNGGSVGGSRKSGGGGSDLKEYEATTNGSSSIYGGARNLFLRGRRDYNINRNVENRVGSANGNNSNCVPFLIVGLVAGFFLVLAALYWGMHSGSNSNELIGKTSRYQPQQN